MGMPVILGAQLLTRPFDPSVIGAYTLCCGLGSNLFYDSVIRDVVEAQRWAYGLQEFVIILIWSFIMSSSAALSLFFTGADAARSWMPVPAAVLVCGSALVLVYFPARAMIGALRPLEKTQDDQLRGLVAGIALRAGLFAGTVASLSCVTG